MTEERTLVGAWNLVERLADRGDIDLALLIAGCLPTGDGAAALAEAAADAAMDAAQQGEDNDE